MINDRPGQLNTADYLESGLSVSEAARPSMRQRSPQTGGRRITQRNGRARVIRYTRTSRTAFEIANSGETAEGEKNRPAALWTRGRDDFLSF